MNVSKNYLKIEEGLCSDHFQIYLTLSDNVIKRNNNLVLVNKYIEWKQLRLRT